MRGLDENAAMPRLSWILAGLDGAADWGAEAADAFGPEFAAVAPPERLVEWIRKTAAAGAPVELVSVEIRGPHTVRARIRDREASVSVVTLAVEPEPPHRISQLYMSALVPGFAAPRLPMDFTGCPVEAGADGARLILFSGLPGGGKSTLADATGRELATPVFAADWLLGSLTPFGGYHLDHLLDIAAEMLTTLAYRQLSLGQSAILDWPAEDPAARTRLRSLAAAAGADFKVVVCVCPDRDVHRKRLEGRTRDIPGWHQGGNWANVERRLAAFPPWAEDEVLTVDTMQPPEACLAAILAYLTGAQAPA